MAIIMDSSLVYYFVSSFMQLILFLSTMVFELN